MWIDINSAGVIGKKLEELDRVCKPFLLLAGCVGSFLMGNLDPAVPSKYESSPFIGNENVNPFLNKKKFRRVVGFSLAVEEMIPNSCNAIAEKRQSLCPQPVSA